MDQKNSRGRYAPSTRNGIPFRLASTCAVALACASAYAFEIPNENTDVKIRWDTSVKYSVTQRLQDADSSLIGSLNLDDGDRNFRKAGLVSNRIDLYTEADIVYKERYGARISGAAWYDAVYNRGNSNDSPSSVNSNSVAPNQFTEATRNLMGRKGELLDAFVFGAADIGDMSATYRLGRHSQVWGETLFFGANGIAGGMAPIDLVKLLTVPGSQFKEVMRPVNQISGQLQVKPGLTLGAYYQLEWEPNRIPAAGAFSSFADIYGVGAEQMIFAPQPGPAFAYGGEVKPDDKGQFGFQVRFRPESMDSEFGLYAIRYHQKDPNAYIRPIAGDYVVAYHEGIRAYGASMSTTIAGANVGLEASYRDNAALANPGVPVLFSPSGTVDDPAMPIGRTAHLNASTIFLLSPNSLWQGGTFLAEVGWNRLLSVTRNPEALDPNATRDAWGFRMIFSPSYFQVMDGVDVSIPMGLGYNPKGRSSAVSMFNGGVDQGGDYSIGISGSYHKRLTFALTYTNYFGTSGGALDSNNKLSFQQYYGDRSNIAASVQMTF